MTFNQILTSVGIFLPNVKKLKEKPLVLMTLVASLYNQEIFNIINWRFFSQLTAHSNDECVPVFLEIRFHLCLL